MFEINNLTHDEYAFDYASASVRSTDQDGRLRVEITPISKATVNPYHGREIPNAAGLGLDPEKVYMLFRDPAELQKAAHTANTIPLLEDHIAVTPDSPAQSKTVGSTGEKAVFEAPYLKNSLVVWERSAIDAIKSGEKKELSCAYRYVADMTPGFYEGRAYDGRMTQIAFNHLALVVAGRCGSDVMVSDSMPPEFITPKDNPSMTKLATDELDDKEKAEDEFEKDDTDKKDVKGDKKMSKDKAKDMKSCDEEMPDAEDEDDEDSKAKDKAKDKKMSKDKKAKDESDQDEDKKAEDMKAMDALISSSVAAAIAATQKEMKERARALRKAEDMVRGEYGSLGMDSAEEVYEFVFKDKGIGFSTLHKSAYEQVAQMAMDGSAAKKEKNSTVVAMDASTVKTLETKYPHMSRISGRSI